MPGGNIVHFAGVRIRVVGTGNLRCTFYGFDKVWSQVLVPIPMQTTDPKEKFRLSNFKSGRAILRGETTELGEIMKVNNITIFAKPLWKEHPA